MPEAWLTAFQLLNKVLKVEENSGKTALIYAAASGVGSSLIQLCKIFGIKTIAVSSNEEKLQYCKELGADHTINYKEGDVSEKVLDLIPNGVDYILDPVFAENFD